MRKLKVFGYGHKDFEIFPRTLREVESEETLKLFEKAIGREILPVVRQAIMKGIENLAGEPEKFRVKPKIHVDMERKLAWPIGFPLYVATENLTNLFIPWGISIGLRSSDGKVIAIQRSLKNKACKGFLGCPAGYMTVAYRDFSKRIFPANIDVLIEIQNNVFDQMRHELGLESQDYYWGIQNLIEVDYPSRQRELIIWAHSSTLTAEEIVARAAKNKGTETGLSENRVIPITDKDLFRFISQGVPMATQHAAALCFATGLDYDLIKKMAKSDPNIPYEKEII